MAEKETKAQPLKKPNRRGAYEWHESSTDALPNSVVASFRIFKSDSVIWYAPRGTGYPESHRTPRDRTPAPPPPPPQISPRWPRRKNGCQRPTPRAGSERGKAHSPREKGADPREKGADPREREGFQYRRSVSLPRSSPHKVQDKNPHTNFKIKLALFSR